MVVIWKDLLQQIEMSMKLCKSLVLSRAPLSNYMTDSENTFMINKIDFKYLKVWQEIYQFDYKDCKERKRVLNRFDDDVMNNTEPRVK